MPEASVAAATTREWSFCRAGATGVGAGVRRRRSEVDMVGQRHPASTVRRELVLIVESHHRRGVRRQPSLIENRPSDIGELYIKRRRGENLVRLFAGADPSADPLFALCAVLAADF